MSEMAVIYGNNNFAPPLFPSVLMSWFFVCLSVCLFVFCLFLFLFFVFLFVFSSGAALSRKKYLGPPKISPLISHNDLQTDGA